MTDDEFCRLYTAYYGEKIDHVEQIVQEVLNGDELKEIIEFFIKYQNTENENR